MWMYLPAAQQLILALVFQSNTITEALVLCLVRKAVFNGRKPFLETSPFAYAST